MSEITVHGQYCDARVCRVESEHDLLVEFEVTRGPFQFVGVEALAEAEALTKDILHTVAVAQAWALHGVSPGQA